MAHLIHFHARPTKSSETAAEVHASPVTTNTRPRSEWRYMAYVLAIALVLLIALVELARAGGPQYVAGVSYFNAGLAGQPVTWPNGAVSYSTDMGNLSPILNGPAADAFVADAFSRWTSISTAAVSATLSGQLAEDVSGANVIMNSDRTITMPPDIQPTATDKPVAIVYDSDGLVTDD